MSSQRPRCPECRTPIRESEINQLQLAPCSGCNSLLQVELFPAFFRASSAGQTADEVLLEGESTCFYHPTKKAVLPCSGCGRFLCSLCDCDLGGNHICPTCLEVHAFEPNGERGAIARPADTCALPSLVVKAEPVLAATGTPSKGRLWLQ